MRHLGQALALLGACVLSFHVVPVAEAHGPYQHFKNAWKAEQSTVGLDSGATVTTNLSLLGFTQNRQQVLVSWTGAQQGDLVALFVPAHSARPVVPIQWTAVADASPADQFNGNGSAVFTLMNMRGSFGFKLVRGGPERPTVVAEAEPIENKIARQPTGGHLTIHKDGRSVVLQWVSSSWETQYVEFGPEPGVTADTAVTPATAGNLSQPSPPRRYRFNASSFRNTYRAQDMCGPPATTVGWMDPGVLHTVVMSGKLLRPGQRYYYRYGREGDGWSPERSFLAPVPPPPAASTATPGLASASGSSSSSRKTSSLGVPHTASATQAHTASSSSVLRDGGDNDGMGSPYRPFAAARATSSSSSSSGDDSAPMGAAANDAPFKFLAFNDVAMANPILFSDPGRGGLHFAPGYGENSTRLAQRLGAAAAEKDASLALLVGDLAYALGFGADWDVFQQQFEEAFTQWPLAVGTGNHERDWPGSGDAFDNTARDSGGECNVPFMWRFYSPANILRDPRTSYYSFEQGPVHFLILDSESPSDPSSPQGKFVAADLASVDRSRTPWVVAAMHRMMQAPATWRRRLVGDLDNMERLQADYEDLFLRYQVDVVIQGHEHSYARTCPMAKGACVEESNSAAQRGARHGSSAAAASRRSLLASGQRKEKGGSSNNLKQITAQAAASQDEGYASEAGKEQQPWWHRQLVTGRPEGQAVQRQYAAPAGGPVYVLAGHAGAGFTHGFPSPLPAWVEQGAEGVNGYARFTATRSQLRMEAVVAEDGAVMDSFVLTKAGAQT